MNWEDHIKLGKDAKVKYSNVNYLQYFIKFKYI